MTLLPQLLSAARRSQREASEANIKSQAHEGWKLIRTYYDDGGYGVGVDPL
jgi:hypothetical protein